MRLPPWLMHITVMDCSCKTIWAGTGKHMYHEVQELLQPIHAFRCLVSCRCQCIAAAFVTWCQGAAWRVVAVVTHLLGQC
jgi:hypothetical protein